MKTPDKENYGQNPHWLNREDNRRRYGYGRRASALERSREDLMKTWYGSEEGRLEILAHQKPAAHIGDPLGGVMAKFGMKHVVMLDDLKEAWPTLVGDDAAKFSEPTSCRNGVLQVEVTHAAWLYVLEREHRSTIEARVAEKTAGKVKSVKFVPVGKRYER